MSLPLEIVDVPYPGFEGRPRAAGFGAFLDAVAAEVARERAPFRLYGTGIGGLLLLALRARGLGLDTPLLLQAPVLWGLADRRMPALARLVPSAFVRAPFRSPLFQAWFARRFFTKPLSRADRAAFFAGYRSCAALPDLFAWLGPPLLRDLERSFGARPDVLANVTFWWGGRDRVLDREELRKTEDALGVRFPVRSFPDWGHYPMIDVPEEWVQAVAGA